MGQKQSAGLVSMGQSCKLIIAPTDDPESPLSIRVVHHSKYKECIPDALVPHPTVTLRKMEMIRQSWNRVMTADSNDAATMKIIQIHAPTKQYATLITLFYDECYQKLFEAYPDSKKLFSGNMVTQGKMLAAVVSRICFVDVVQDHQKLVPMLETLADSHVEFGVRPEYYGGMATAIIHGVSLCLGDEWTPELESAWREVFSLICIILVVRTCRRLDKSKRGTFNNISESASLLFNRGDGTGSGKVSVKKMMRAARQGGGVTPDHSVAGSCPISNGSESGREGLSPDQRVSGSNATPRSFLAGNSSETDSISGSISGSISHSSQGRPGSTKKLHGGGGGGGGGDICPYGAGPSPGGLNKGSNGSIASSIASSLSSTSPLTACGMSPRKMTKDDDDSVAGSPAGSPEKPRRASASAPHRPPPTIGVNVNGGGKSPPGHGHHRSKVTTGMREALIPDDEIEDYGHAGEDVLGDVYMRQHCPCPCPSSSLPPPPPLTGSVEAAEAGGSSGKLAGLHHHDKRGGGGGGCPYRQKKTEATIGQADGGSSHHHHERTKSDVLTRQMQAQLQAMATMERKDSMLNDEKNGTNNMNSSGNHATTNTHPRGGKEQKDRHHHGQAHKAHNSSTSSSLKGDEIVISLANEMDAAVAIAVGAKKAVAAGNGGGGAGGGIGEIGGSGSGLLTTPPAPPKKGKADKRGG